MRGNPGSMASRYDTQTAILHVGRFEVYGTADDLIGIGPEVVIILMPVRRCPTVRHLGEKLRPENIDILSYEVRHPVQDQGLRSEIKNARIDQTDPLNLVDDSWDRISRYVEFERPVRRLWLCEARPPLDKLFEDRAVMGDPLLRQESIENQIAF